mmetsp:Transcript_30352/g.81619  ORF Transcript_30352/g.81619 Transcript_30352/m.81619 type:complete len:299 (-) Transcript_30352:98-994(-)
MTSLADYVSRMPAHQQAIYFISGESLRAVSRAPALEGVQKRGYEVLFLVDPIDEYAAAKVQTYKGKPLVSVTQEGLHIDAADNETAAGEARELEAARERLAGLCDALQGALGDRVEKVVVSSRLASSPCTLVTSDHGWSANMERILKAQAMRDPATAMLFAGRRTLEVNPEHPIVEDLRRRVEGDVEDSTVKEVAHLLYETAAIDSGFTLDDPAAFSQRIHRMITLGLSIGDVQDAALVDGVDNDDHIRASAPGRSSLGVGAGALLGSGAAHEGGCDSTQHHDGSASTDSGGSDDAAS